MSTQQIGEDLLKAGKYDEAAQHFASLLFQANDAESWNGWASAQANLGNFAEAVEGFERALALDPEDFIVRENCEALAGILIEQRSSLSAQISPEDQEKLHLAAVTSFKRQKNDEALKSFRELLFVTENARIWNDLGTIHVASGNPTAAEVCYRRAVTLDGENRRALINLTLLLEQILRPNAALEFQAQIPVEDLIRERAAARSAIVNAALTPAIDRAKHIESLIQAIAQLPPHSPKMPAALSAALLVNKADPSWFVSRCCALLANEPEDCRIEVIESLARSDYRMLLVMAQFHLDHGDYDAALPLIQKAGDANPADLFAARLLDRCQQHKTGNPDATGEYLASRFCSVPFEHFEIAKGGDVYLCCPAWLPVPIGNMSAGSPEGRSAGDGSTEKSPAGESAKDAIWNSRVAQEIRSSILDGSFRYCSRTHCPEIAGRRLPAKDLVQIEGVQSQKTYTVKAPGPQQVTLSYDATCNLACPQCRTDFLFATPVERKEMDGYIPLILELAKDARFVYLNGAGEVFGSRHSREILQQFTREKFPALKFKFITNANLLDRRAWDHFDLRRRVADIDVSIDAATPATYAIVRKGGSLERLLGNLRFLRDLRLNEGEDFTMVLRYVVSGLNYREMPAFVDLAKELHAERIAFTRFRNWGTFDETGFNAMNITDPAHPEHEAFLQVLQHPALADSVVDLGSVYSFRDAKHVETAMV